MKSAIAAVAFFALATACSSSQPSGDEAIKIAQESLRASRLACAAAEVVQGTPEKVLRVCRAMKAAEADAFEVLDPWPSSAGTGGSDSSN